MKTSGKGPEQRRRHDEGTARTPLVSATIAGQLLDRCGFGDVEHPHGRAGVIRSLRAGVSLFGEIGDGTLFFREQRAATDEGWASVFQLSIALGLEKSW